jgi:hypothetical protein
VHEVTASAITATRDAIPAYVFIAAPFDMAHIIDAAEH